MTIAKRQKMIHGQLLPAGVINDNLLGGFLNIDRTQFVDGEDQQKRCYSDMPMVSRDGRVLLPPVAAGLLLQQANLGAGDKALVIGGGHGYECNILASTNIGVVALASPRDKIKKNILKGNFYVAMADDITLGFAKHAPYQAIFIFGLLQAVPEKLLNQLSAGGYLLTALLDKKSPQTKNQLGNLVRVAKNKKIHYFGQVTDVPLMPEFMNQHDRIDLMAS